MKKTCISTFKILLASAFIFLLTGVHSYGQDIIVQKTGDEIKAKVEQVLDTEIRYRKFENLTGPVYTIKKDQVFMIRYENGTKDVFTTQPAPVVTQPQTAPASKVNYTDNDIQHAKTASIISYVIIAPIMTLGTLSAFADDEDLSIGTGAGATVIAGVGIPIAAIMAAKTRKITGVEGNPGLRTAGWVGYGLTIADAITMLALSEDVDFGAGLILSVAILGSLSSACFGIEASQTAQQAKSRLTNVSIQPTVGYVRDFTGKKYNTIGLRINF
jgi:hypothetical protein